VRWIHAQVPPEPWVQGIGHDDDGILFPVGCTDGRLDATLSQYRQIRVAKILLDRIVSLFLLVLRAGGYGSVVAPWASGVWAQPSVSALASSHSFCRSQIDLCHWLPYRRSTCVYSNAPLVQVGNIICPGASVSSHRRHKPLRGRITRNGRSVLVTSLVRQLPIAVSRWLARCVVQTLSEAEKPAVDVYDKEGAQFIFPQVPRELVEDAAWHLFYVRKWEHASERIYIKEGRASVLAFLWALGNPRAFGTRILTLCDNETCVLAFCKGRSKVLSLLRLSRRILGASVAARAKGVWRHLQGYRHPCDGPTRPEIIGRAYRPVGGNQWRLDAGLHPGACLARLCPPGLCRCA